MIHRYAYVGNDLQDIYGINALNIGDAADLSNAFFASNDAQATLRKLASRPDGVLLSQETVNDFQLKMGDLVYLRLQNAKDHQYQPIPFHFIGVVREFSTAPKDSFILANEGYIASQTGDSAHEVVLVRGSIPPAQLAKSLTWDLGHEMAQHQRFSEQTGMTVYFCDPKSPWQRGSNENTNGLLRQYLPRRLDFRTLTQTDFDQIAAELNDRPRQTLGFKTPSQALAEVMR